MTIATILRDEVTTALDTCGDVGEVGSGKNRFVCIGRSYSCDVREAVRTLRHFTLAERERFELSVAV